jgi:hypothetical protein
MLQNKRSKCKILFSENVKKENMKHVTSMKHVENRETLVDFLRPTRRYIPEDGTLRLKSYQWKL